MTKIFGMELSFMKNFFGMKLKVYGKILKVYLKVSLADYVTKKKD
jgi:hypothetical protein